MKTHTFTMTEEQQEIFDSDESAARKLRRRFATLARAVADATGAQVTLETADGRVLEVFSAAAHMKEPPP